MSTLHTGFLLLKKQQLAWSCAIIVGLFLVLIGHVPILPVFMGCGLAVAVAVLRSWPRTSVHAMRRSGR